MWLHQIVEHQMRTVNRYPTQKKPLVAPRVISSTDASDRTLALTQGKKQNPGMKSQPKQALADNGKLLSADKAVPTPLPHYQESVYEPMEIGRFKPVMDSRDSLNPMVMADIAVNRKRGFPGPEKPLINLAATTGLEPVTPAL